MNKQTTFIVIGAVALLGGLFVLGQPSGVTEAPAPAAEEVGASALAAVESSFDFGAISMARGKVQRKFMVKNTSAEPVTVRAMYTSCMCTSASIVKGDERFGPFGMQGHGFIPRINMTFAPGEEAEVLATFDPAAHGPAGVGKIARTIYLEQEGRQPLELGISAVVEP